MIASNLAKHIYSELKLCILIKNACTVIKLSLANPH